MTALYVEMNTANGVDHASNLLSVQSHMSWLKVKLPESSVETCSGVPSSSSSSSFSSSSSSSEHRQSTSAPLGMLAIYHAMYMSSIESAMLSHNLSYSSIYSLWYHIIIIITITITITIVINITARLILMRYMICKDRYSENLYWPEKM